ncbi:MAG: hypothetical protein E7234_05935 [Lachnospiraceae bacterium]|nr:hypothetical protein [Lachnospiraceae bacterium]
MIARRTEIKVSFNGSDITSDISKYLLSMTYTDHEEDKTDDLQLTIDDRENTWLSNWLNLGSDAKGAEISAVIVQKNWDSSGRDKILDCGIFELDSIDVSGPASTISLKCTSLPYTSTVRTEKKTKAWETISLNGIASEIAANNGMQCMFESSDNPFYERKEQIQTSDIVFLQGLCKDAGISLKVTAKALVLFNELTYEQKEAVREIKMGSADVINYSFSTNYNDTAYSKCKVSYTNPSTGKTISYTYTPRNNEGTGQVLEINEKVNSREEARQLAMKRLRQKNKSEYKASFSLVGDLDLVAGVTVNISGWGMFDGKYIIETATHSLTGGYKVSLTLRRVLEEY